MKKQWFDVDKTGLSKQAEEQGKGRLVGELVQNALDEPGIAQIAITLVQVPGQELAELAVDDDASGRALPEGQGNGFLNEFGQRDHLLFGS